MARIEYPVWTVSRAALAMPFRHPMALLKFGLLPLLLAVICLPPPLNFSHTTEVSLDGTSIEPVGGSLSTTDNQLGLRDLIGFILMLPCAAAFAAAWNRLMATGDETAMGRPPFALDARTWSVIWAFLRLAGIFVGMLLILSAALFLIFGRYQDGTLSFDISYKASIDGYLPTLAMMGTMLCVVLVGAWFLLRLALVIPAGAMGEPLTLRGSWRLSAPIQFRLFGAAILLTFAYLLLNFLLLAAMAPLTVLAGLEGAFYVTLAPYFLLVVYAHAIWSGLLGATYGLLRPQESTKTASVFD